jgi:CheY-like chemotaxis protein
MLDLLYNDVGATMLSPAHLAQPQCRPLRILIVEDNPDAAGSLAMLLRLDKHEVEIALDGRTALQKAALQEPDVVLLDIGLPGMDGFEVAKGLKALPPDKQPFIVAITGFGADEYRNRSVQAGIEFYFVKPIDPELLLSLLRRLAQACC